jgi:hypothetical protein
VKCAFHAADDGWRVFMAILSGFVLIPNKYYPSLLKTDAGILALSSSEVSQI